MLSEFIADWQFFYAAFIAGWMIAVVLALIGVVVVARDQIFIGAAISQGSALGIALGLAVGVWVGAEHHDLVHSRALLSALAVAAAILAALVTARGSDADGGSYEAVTGWVYLVGASGSILLLANNPVGLEKIHELVASSVVFATDADLWLFGSLLVVSIAILLMFYRTIAMLAVDPAMAPVLGVRSGLWSLLLCAWLGLVVGLSIRVSGLLFTFGCLVLPALVARNLCREVRGMFVVAPIIALVCGVLGFILASEYDYPPAQVVVALLAVLVALTWAFRAVRSA